MEENQNASLFGLGIDPAAKAHLSEAARWARFLAIVGFVIIGLLVVMALFAGAIFGTYFNAMSPQGGGAMAAGMGVGFTLYMLICAAIGFFPFLFLYRFSAKAKAALASGDQGSLNSSLQNLKVYFRYLGIITIIVLALYAIGLLVALLGAGLGR
ncbi:MAG: hypothetical protein ABUT20_61745 [Bacteroidota bacterium]